MNDEDKKQILKLTEQVGQLNGKVEQMDKNISKNFTSLELRVVGMHNSIKGKIKQIDERVNKNEDKISHMKGTVAGIALAISLGISLISFLRNWIK